MITKLRTIHTCSILHTPCNKSTSRLLDFQSSPGPNFKLGFRNKYESQASILPIQTLISQIRLWIRVFMEKSNSFKGPQNPWSADLGLGTSDRRLAFSRQASFQQYHEPHTPVSINLNDSEATPFLSRSVSSIDVPPGAYLAEENDKLFGERRVSAEKLSVLLVFESVFRILRSGNRYMKRLFLLISLNVAYSTAELCIGLFTGRIGS